MKNRSKVDELRDVLKRKNAAPPLPYETGKTADAEEKAQPDTSGGDDLSSQIHAAEEEAKNHYDKLLRVMAEFENFKKRMTKEREEQFKYANEKLLAEILTPIDDLDRVLDHVPIDAPPEAKNIAEGVGLVRKSILTILERFGLKEVPAEGELFDPAIHEAIAVIESDTQKPGHVISVHRRGYTLGDRLLRAAMVTVAKDTSDVGHGT